VLLTIPDVLTPAELVHARQVMENAEWLDGRGTAGAQAAQVKQNEQLDAAGPAARELQAMVLAALERQPLFFSAALPKRVLPPLFNRYAGQRSRYGDHVDQAIRFPVAGERLRADISCTLFMADTAAYDGGALVIEEPDGPRQVRLPAGHLVLYPATSVHRVEAVTRGTRLAAFFWVESLVRLQEQRRLLFELDTNLTRLRERHGDCAETVALTGTYHNLLRLWADT
jgi:PKHD-type hydroxylase